nr:MAG TPA: hypothetical protein [Caudoviricetes sp.]
MRAYLKNFGISRLLNPILSQLHKMLFFSSPF